MALPRTDNELVVWLNNFTGTFSSHAAALGFTAADVTAVQNDAAMLQYLVGNLVPAFKNALQARTSYKNLIKDGPVGAQGGAMPAAPTVDAPPATVAPGIVPRLRQLIQRIQVAPGYTEAIGRDLGITADDGGEAPDPSSAKPSARAVALPSSEVRIELLRADSMSWLSKHDARERMNGLRSARITTALIWTRARLSRKAKRKCANIACATF